jgi:hypothetical protein
MDAATVGSQAYMCFLVWFQSWQLQQSSDVFSPSSAQLRMIYPFVHEINHLIVHRVGIGLVIIELLRLSNIIDIIRRH